jgi:hypothetical protein
VPDVTCVCFGHRLSHFWQHRYPREVLVTEETLAWLDACGAIPKKRPGQGNVCGCGLTPTLSLILANTYLNTERNHHSCSRPEIKCDEVMSNPGDRVYIPLGSPYRSTAGAKGLSLATLGVGAA